MYAEAFKEAHNLLAANMYWPYKMVITFAEKEPAKVRELFKMLYNESIPLAQRYVDFRAAFDEFYKPQGLNHYQDLHAISVYLTFEYPDKYYIYKYKVFKDFSNNIGYVIDRSKFQSEVYKLEAYFEMCELVLDEVKKDSPLQETSAARLDDTCYDDKGLHLLTHDIVYFGSQNALEEEAVASDWWPTLDEYDPNLSKDDAHKERSFVEYDEFNTNRAENKILKSTLSYLYKCTTSSRNKSDIKTLLNAFNSVDESNEYKSDFAKIVPDRKTADYQTALMWSKVFLMGKSFTSFSGSEVAFALLFPMETLFESYIAAQLKKMLGHSEYSLSAQDKTYHLFDGPRKFLMKPDIVIKNKALAQVFVMDTKWKVLSADKANYAISQADMYQMYAYQKKYTSENVTLLYPLTEKVDPNQNIEFLSNDGTVIRIRFVDLFDLSNSLNAIVGEIKGNE